MAKLSDIEESQKVQSNAPDVTHISSLPSGEADSTSEHIIFRLMQSNRNGGVYLPSVADCIDPVTKKLRRARLLVGVDTIWLDEQKGVEKDYAQANSRTLEFPRGSRMLILNRADETGILFARLSPHNMAGTNIKTNSKMQFYEYNPKKQQEDALKLEMLEIEMAIEASKKEGVEMRKHALFLGIQPMDDVGQPKTDSGIKREYILAAKRNPVHFKNTLGSKEIEVHYLVRRAISEALIDLGNGNAKWANNGGAICFIPKGESPYTYLTNFATTNSEDGKNFLQLLKQNVT
jgi:hypothetical protein